jgi:hypothetical protein
MGWQLADATPRKLVLNSGFMHSLRKYLQWSTEQDPALSDLHPSLGNFDRVARIISQLREKYFPHGTGLQGQ